MADIASAVRVNETSTSTSSPYALAGAATSQKNLRAFVDAGVNGKEVFIMESHREVDNEWQLSRAKITNGSPDTYVINRVISSATGSQIAWTAGTRDVFLVDLHGYSPGPQHTVTDDTTIDETYFEVIGNFSTLKTITLPPVAQYQGKVYWFKFIGSATMKIAEDSGDSSTLEGPSGTFGTAINLTTAGQWLQLRSDGTKWRRVGSHGMSIAGEVVAGTSGSILYVDANGDLAQDNSNIFYDATNKRVGLLTSSPSYPLDIDLTASPADTKAARATIGADNDDGWRCEGTITGTGRPFNAVMDCSDRVICSIQNTNTGGGNAAFEAITASGSGDPRLDLTVSGEQAWTLGIDNSDSNKFKLDSTSALDSSPLLEVTTTGLIGINKADPAAQLNLQPRTLGTIGFIIEHAPGQTADSLQVIDDSDTIIFVVDAAGKLGVGVPDPSNLIDAEIAGADAKLRLSSTGGSNDAWVNVDDGSQDWSFGVDNDKSGAFKLVPLSTLNAAPAIICDTGLDVGIGFLGTSSSVPTTLTVRDDPGNSPSDSLGLAIINDIAAVANVSGDDGQSYSPALRWEGQGWKTDATAASQSVEFRQYLQPIQGAASPTAKLLLEASINGGAYSSLLDISSGGTLFLTEQAAAIADVAGKGQLWVRDDTPNVLVFTDDAGTDTVLGGGGSPGGADTELQYNNSGAFGGISSVTWDGTTLGVDNAAVFNESGADVDFRVEGSGASNALFVQGSDGFVGVNETSPGAQLHVQTSGTGVIGQIIKATAGQTADLFNIQDSSSNKLLAVNGSGEVGINLVRAGSHLTIQADEPQLRLEKTGTARRAHIAFYRNSAVNWYLGTPDSDVAGAGDEFFIGEASGGSGAALWIETGGDVGVGITSGHDGKLHIDQSSATGAKPVLTLDQADVSEEMIRFESTIGVGNAIEAVGAKTLTTTHFIKVELTGGLTRYIPVGTIA